MSVIERRRRKKRRKRRRGRSAARGRSSGGWNQKLIGGSARLICEVRMLPLMEIFENLLNFDCFLFFPFFSEKVG